jgi:hypothetical protein
MDQPGRSGVPLNGGGSEDKPGRSAESAPGVDQSRPGVPDGDGPVDGPGNDVPGRHASGEPAPDPGAAARNDQPGVEGVERGDRVPPGGESPGSSGPDDGDVPPDAVRNIGIPPLTLNIGEGAEGDSRVFELARRTADLQEQQIHFQMRIQQQELDLRRTTQENELALRRDMQQKEYELRAREQANEYELRKIVIERADQSEQDAVRRAMSADDARVSFARRGQTFAMRLVGCSAIALFGSGIAVVFLTVFGTVASSTGIALASILLAAGLFTAVSKAAGRFLPRPSDEARSLERPPNLRATTITTSLRTGHPRAGGCHRLTSSSSPAGIAVV